MAGLPLFGGTFRHWMGGGTSTPPKQNTIDAKGHNLVSNKRSIEAIQSVAPNAAEQNSRVRQSGIRENTDESWDLPGSTEIMQHLAEAYRNNDAQNTGRDGSRLSSDGSTVTNHNMPNEFESTHLAYDNIEAEIDQLKQDIVKLRGEADLDRATPKNEPKLASDKFLTTCSGSTQKMSTESALESAAAHLQKRHEARISAADATSREHSDTQQPLTLQDFPALDRCRQGSNVISHTDPGCQQRKPSYANVASNGTTDVTNRTSTVTSAKRGNTKALDSASEVPFPAVSMPSPAPTSSTADALDLCESKKEDEYSVIVSPRSDQTISSTNEPVFVWKGMQSAKNGKPEKQQPRFAQPTQSFSRRTGETLRVGSSPVSPKSSPGPSPTRITKAKEPYLATDKRAAERQLKRKSLPGDWLGAGMQVSDQIAQELATKATNTMTSTPDNVSQHMGVGSPGSAEGWEIVEGRHAKENAATMRAKVIEVKGKSTACEKPKPYMAPTNAATQRAIATLGREKAKRDLQETKSTVPHPTETHDVQQIASNHRCSTASSDVSSVQFILDQPRPDFSLVPVQNGTKTRLPSENSQDIQSRTKISPVASPSKIPSPHHRKQNGSSKASVSAARLDLRAQQPRNKDSTGFGQMPEVANTTTKRRTSRGHILQPIWACLDAKGLLNKTSAKSAVESYLDNVSCGLTTSASNAPYDSKTGMSTQPLEPKLAVSQQNTGGEPVKKAIAPHLRKAREASQATSTADATVHPPEQRSAMTFTAREQITSTSVDESPSVVACGMPSLGQPSRVSSLRATANEFKPMVTATEKLNYMDIQNIMKYKSSEQWHAMTGQEKDAVRHLRMLHQHGAVTSANTFPLQASSPREAINFTDSLNEEMPMAFSNADNPSTKSVDENGSPTLVRAGQILRPSISPGKKSVHWLLRDLDGRETPVKFGRAPSPFVSPIWESPSTPSISPNSNDTSPLKTPHSTRGWQIGSASSPVPYGWAGGDGKEIKFVGYGPHAERDPNSVVKFNFQGRTASYNNASVSNGFDESKENRPTDAHVAPKSQRQWAEKFGYQKVPCGNIEITQAVENCIPFGSQLAGYCFDCMAR